MENNVNYTVVGGFVVILLSVIILAIIWLSSGLSTGEPYVIYKVYMQESVSGLNIDSSVEYNGVNVGTVKSIELNAENPRLVELLLNIKKSTPVTVGTRAILNTRGLTGIAFLALKDLGSDTTALKARPGEKYPVIGTAPSFMLRLDAAITQLTKSFKELSKSVHSVLDDENLVAIKASLKNIESFTDMLSKHNMQFGSLLQSGSDATQLLQTQTIPIANQALLHLNTLTRQFSEIGSELKQNPSMIIRGREPQPLGPGEK